MAKNYPADRHAWKPVSAGGDLKDSLEISLSRCFFGAIPGPTPRRTEKGDIPEKLALHLNKRGQNIHSAGLPSGNKGSGRPLP